MCRPPQGAGGGLFLLLFSLLFFRTALEWAAFRQLMGGWLGQREDWSGRLSVRRMAGIRLACWGKGKSGEEKGGHLQKGRGWEKRSRVAGETHGFSDLFLGRSPPRCEPRRSSDHISHHICSSCIFLMGFSFHSLLEWVCSAILSFFFDFIWRYHGMGSFKSC